MLTKITLVAAVAILALTHPALGEGPAAQPEVARVPTMIERGAPAATAAHNPQLTFSAKFIQRHNSPQDAADRGKVVMKAEAHRGERPPSRVPLVTSHGGQDPARRERANEVSSRVRASKLKARRKNQKRYQLRIRGLRVPRGAKKVIAGRSADGSADSDGQACAATETSDVGKIEKRSARFVKMRRGLARFALL